MRIRRVREIGQSDEQRVQSAMKSGLVDLVEKLLGEPPAHMYDYGMQFAWKKRARQWVADQKRPPAIYPVHCWSAGYGGPQSPLTWFRCKTCGENAIGSPHELPRLGCMRCVYSRRGNEFVGWEVTDTSSAFASTLEAAEGMPSHSVAKVLDGPS